VTAGLLVAACGSSSSISLAVTIGSRSAAVHTFAIAITEHDFETADPAQVVVSSTGNGVVDLARNATHLTIAESGLSRTPFEEIVIGRDMWIRNPVISGMPGFPLKAWSHVRSTSARLPFPGVDPATVFARLDHPGVTLKLVGHQIVRGVATNEYAVSWPVPMTTTTNQFVGSEGPFDIWVDSSHLLRRLSATTVVRPQPHGASPIPATTNQFTLDFYNFGVPVDIEPPPADQVSDLPSPGLGSSAPPTTAVSLPSATIATRSTLQLRPVLSMPGGSCPAPGANPRADETVTLPGPDGCYLLGPTALTIAHAQARARPPNSDLTNVLTLDLTFGQADSAAFDEMAARFLHQQVAIIMFGRVLTAPSIQTSQFNGSAAIQLDPQTAANVIAALSG
jgi:hypothetical protein